VVVAVGFMLIEPLAEVDVNVPGAMAILVAPAAAQLSVLLVPEFTLAGSAVKEVIVGTESFAEDELDELDEPQLTSPAQATRMRASAQRSSPGGLSPRQMSLLLQNQFAESTRNSLVAVVCTGLVFAASLSGS